MRLPAVGAQEDEQAACTALPLPPGAAGIFLDQSDNGVTNPALLQTLVKVGGGHGRVSKNGIRCTRHLLTAEEADHMLGLPTALPDNELIPTPPPQ